VADELEAPRSPSDLYRARGEEVDPCRPYLTGDVFVNVETTGPDGSPKKRDVMIIQHPCALRTNGIDLVPQMLMAKVQQHKLIDDWAGYTKLMPLPDLYPQQASERRRHYAAMFDSLHMVTQEQLGDQRVACLAQPGINLLLQRWVYHSSRTEVSTAKFDGANRHIFDEAELIEDWCADRVDDGIKLSEAAAQCMAWLNEDIGNGLTRQRSLRNPQQRSTVRMQMRSHLAALRRSEPDRR